MSPSIRFWGSLVQEAWLGHVVSMSEDRPPLKLHFSQLPGPGIKGRTRKTWRNVVQSDMAGLNITNIWFMLVPDRLAWRQLIEPTHT